MCAKMGKFQFSRNSSEKFDCKICDPSRLVLHEIAKVDHKYHSESIHISVVGENAVTVSAKIIHSSKKISGNNDPVNLLEG
jgi:hypothetical protein